MILKAQRLSKEYKLTTISKNFKSSFGTTNRIEPKVLYIKLFAWAKHTANMEDYALDVEQLIKKIKLKFKEYAIENDIFDSQIYFNINMKKLIVKENETFHASFEFTIKQKDPINSNIIELRREIENITNNTITQIERSSNFEFSIKKIATSL